MDNKVFCKTRMSGMGKGLIIPTILGVISFVAFILSMITISQTEDFRSDRTYYYNCYGEEIAWGYDGRIYTYGCFTNTSGIITFAIFAIFVLLIIWVLCSRLLCKKCDLELNQDGIFGRKKTLFSLQTINQPFEKIDNIYVRDSIIDKILGGQTIAIRSASSCIKFCCIANAQEFVDKTLEELKKYKESVNSKSEKTPAASDGDAMDALLKLKNLLNQGLITQEEYEEKRKSFVNKI